MLSKMGCPDVWHSVPVHQTKDHAKLGRQLKQIPFP